MYIWSNIVPATLRLHNSILHNKHIDNTFNQIKTDLGNYDDNNIYSWVIKIKPDLFINGYSAWVLICLQNMT